MDNHDRHERPSLVWPILLIGLGVILLLSNLDILPGDAWALLWRLWPLALVLIGLDVLIGRRSTLGSVIAALVALAVLFGVIALLLLAPSIPALQLDRLDELQTRNLQTPLENVQTADVFIDWDPGENALSALPPDNPYWIDGTVEFFGGLTFDVDRSGSHGSIRLDASRSGIVIGGPDSSRNRWDVRLHPEVVYDLTLDSGSGSQDLDLSRFALSRLSLDTGSGATNLSLPPGDYRVILDGGSGGVQIAVPETAGLRVQLDSGSGSMVLPDSMELVSGELDGDGVWETADIAQSESRIEMTIDQGSGAIAIRQTDNP